MPAVVKALWCVAVLLSHVVPSVSVVSGAEHRFGRPSNKRASHNDTRIDAVSTSPAEPIVLGSYRAPVLDAVESSLGLTGASSYAASDPTTTSPAQGATTAVSSATDQAVTSESDHFLSLLGLGTITTLARPPLAYPSTAPRTSKATTAITTITTTSFISSTPYLLNSSSTAEAVSPNGTLPSWNWNSTASLTSPTATLPLTTPPLPTSSATLTSDEDGCPSSKSGDYIIVTSYSIRYTSTTTWTKDPADYTPPFPPISTPEACTPPKTSPTGRLTVSVCDGTGKTCTPLHSTGDPTGETTYTGAIAPTETQTVIFVTTDKNPAVVFSSATPPSYGGSPESMDSHGTASGRHPIATPNYGAATPWDQPARTKTAAVPSPGNGLQATAPVTVVIQPGEVVLNHKTFTDGPERSSSTVVVVDGNTFAIDPSRVVGAGATITRPPSAGGIFVHLPTTTTIDGLEVVYGPSVATIDGTAFTVSPTPTAVTVRGRPLAIGPEGVVFPSQTLLLLLLPDPDPDPGRDPDPTEVAVLGGELITALGTDRVVIEGATLTYGAAAAPATTRTEVVNGDTVLVGPAGVVVHAKTLGGAAAAPGATAYEMVGGATVTRLGATAVVVGGVTYPVGRGAPATTRVEVLGGETVTIGPGGVAVSTWTFGGGGGGGDSAWTTTISAASNAVMAAVPTAEESPGLAARHQPDWGLTLRLSCVAMGAAVLGPLLFWV